MEKLGESSDPGAEGKQNLGTDDETWVRGQGDTGRISFWKSLAEHSLAFFVLEAPWEGPLVYDSGAILIEVSVVV